MTITNPDLISVRLPIYWASYIANDVKDDVHFERAYYPGLDAGDYCTYVFYQL